MLSDTLQVLGRTARQDLRSPAWVVAGLAQPVLYLLLFAPLLEAVAAAPGFGPGDHLQVFVPALLVQQALFGSLFVGFGLMADVRAGVLDRMRVTPVPRAALLLGRVLRDVAVLLVQALLLLGCATLLGLRAPLLGVAVGLVLVALVGAALSAVSYALALRIRSEGAFAPLLNAFSLPLLLLSGVLLPMGLAPAWLHAVSRANPFAHVVDAERAAFVGDLGRVALTGGAVAAALALAAGAWGVRTFHREAA
ncbi:ABC transporter permease [Vallicoccus soli]|uniref:Transport permease protein n=1 Tax=Vallicoccus soli TaxID=2339232 RepID=A0A3A3Z5G7_9ACTN|nr:ABC transporter permease [Vallicoccus soli]RJK98198.1 ABC transporter permease [Vallicoccus soli]